MNRIRLALSCMAMALIVSGVGASSASAHPGNGSHFFCNKLVPARGYCSGFDGILIGYGFTNFIYGAYPGKDPIEICVIDDVYRRSPSGFVKRFKVCGRSSASLGGVEMRGSDAFAQGGFPSDYNGLNYYEVVELYNRSAYAHTLRGAAVGNAQY
jgi:hypothetical protein